MHERCCVRECDDDDAGAAMAWRKSARSARCAHLGIPRHLEAVAHWSAVMKLQPDLVVLFIRVRRARCGAVGRRAELLAAASSAAVRAMITCYYCSCWDVWRAVKSELVGRRCCSGVRSIGSHQCRAKGALGGEVTPERDVMPAMLLSGSDCAAAGRNKSNAYLLATGNFVRALPLLESARYRSDERSGARARLDATALVDGKVTMLATLLDALAMGATIARNA